MWMRIASLIATGILAAWILSRRHPREALIPLILSALNGIPLFILGNSANGSIFSIDVVLVAFVVRFGPSHGHELVSRARARGVLPVFFALAIWTLLCGMMACIEEPPVTRFAAYGMARWWMFLVLLIIFFGQELTHDQLIQRFRQLAIVLMAYGCLCVAHQHGAIDLGGDETLGERATEAIEAAKESQETDLAAGHRRFLGMTSANIGSVCAMGMWVPLALVAIERRSHLAWLLPAALMLWAMVGTWSRSNVLGAGAGLIFGLGFSLRFLTGSSRLAVGAALSGVAALCLLILMLAPRSLETPTIDRYLGTLGEYGAHGGGTGGHRFREHNAILRYLVDHPQTAICGLGANGYRRLMWHGAATMMFGHNVYLHTLYELGIPGAALLAIWLWHVARLGAIGSLAARFAGDICHRQMTVLVSALLIQRLIAGWGADTLFATEGMLQSNVLLLALTGLPYSTCAAPIISGREHLSHATVPPAALPGGAT